MSFKSLQHSKLVVKIFSIIRVLLRLAVTFVY